MTQGDRLGQTIGQGAGATEVAQRSVRRSAPGASGVGPPARPARSESWCMADSTEDRAVARSPSSSACSPLARERGRWPGTWCGQWTSNSDGCARTATPRDGAPRRRPGRMQVRSPPRRRATSSGAPVAPADAARAVRLPDRRQRRTCRASHARTRRGACRRRRRGRSRSRTGSSRRDARLGRVAVPPAASRAHPPPAPQPRATGRLATGSPSGGSTATASPSTSPTAGEARRTGIPNSRATTCDHLVPQRAPDLVG